ncbi:tetratricopeptide repeat protein [Candidatus Sumerlaeota bacterium]|nr:tetratricopeptide repeat protein [Candidatus Sumerlaeota bacterium]
MGRRRENSSKDAQRQPYKRKLSKEHLPSQEGIEQIEKILNQVEDEYRTAAVLFIDISEYSRLSATLPDDKLEEVHQLLEEFYDICSYYISLYNGFIVKFIGDAVLAIFGAPVAYERDAESAVRAALEIRNQISTISSESIPQIQVKCGIDTGKIMCVIRRKAGKASFDVFGDAVILAQRLYSIAKPQQIIISTATHKLVNRVVECRRLRARKVKNIPQKVIPYEVIGLKEVSPLSRDFTTPFVGREHELSSVQEAIDQVVDGEFRVLTITGEAGVGKSRLFIEALKPYRQKLKLLLAENYPYAEKIPFFSVTELLSQEFGIRRGDSPKEVASKLESYLSQLEEFDTEDLLYFKFLFSLDEALEELKDVPPEVLHTRIFGLCNRLFKVLSRSKPLVVCMDDYHWADSVSREFLRYFARQTGLKNILLVLIFRYEYQPCIGEIPVHTSIELKELSPQERMKLLGLLIDVKFLLPEIRSLILRRSEGNPLYIEELIKALLEVFSPEEIRNTGTIAKEIEDMIPFSLREIIQARIDKLERQTKLVLQCGAVLGRKFSLNLIELFEIIHDGLLEQLQELKGFEFITENYTTKGLEFAFRHPLIQEVAYDSLLARQRKQLHLFIAEKLEQIFSDRLAQYYPLLAYHYGKGGDIDKTIFYLIKSAEQMMSFFANRDALESLNEALRLLQEDTKATPEHKQQMIQVLKSKGRLHRLMGEMEEAKEVLEALLQLAEHLDMPQMEICGRRELGLVHQQLGDVMSAKYILQSALDLSQQLKLLEEESLCQNAMGVLLWSLGEYDRALEKFLKVAGAGIEDKLPNLMADALNNAGLIYWRRADYEQGLKYMKDALTFRKKARDKFGVSATLMNIGILEEQLGHYEKANKAYTDALKLAEKIEYKQVQTAVLTNLGSLALKLGEHNKALEFNSRSLLLAQETEDSRSEAIALENLALSYIALKKHSEAKETLQQAIQVASRVGDQQCIVSLQLASLELALSSRVSARDLTRIEQTIRAINEHEYTDSLPRAYRIKGQILQQLNRPEEAEKSLLEALELAKKSRNLYDQTASLKALKNYYISLSNKPRADYYAKLLSQIHNLSCS